MRHGIPHEVFEQLLEAGWVGPEGLVGTGGQCRIAGGDRLPASVGDRSQLDGFDIGGSVFSRTSVNRFSMSVSTRESERLIGPICSVDLLVQQSQSSLGDV